MGKMEQRGGDGYSVVGDCFASCDAEGSKVSSASVKSEIEEGKGSACTAALLCKYPDRDRPAWVFMEVISFGTFIGFYRFCADRYGDAELKNDYFLLQSVKAARNACAHNSCMLNNMATDSARFPPQRTVAQALCRIGIGQNRHRSKMGDEVFQQIATTFYLHQLLASPGVKEHRADLLKELVKRIRKHEGYYAENYEISSGFAFILKLIEAWYPCEDTAEEETVAD